MLPPYNRPFLSFADQVTLLSSRGLAVTDAWRAGRHLQRIGYYRLKDYWFPFRETRTTIDAQGRPVQETLETFRAGTRFEDAVALYVFDKRLRLVMMDVIERIEIALRVDIAHTLGARDLWAHRAPGFLDPKRSVSPTRTGTRHGDWLARSDAAEARSRAEWVRAYRGSYSSPLPVVMAVETWEFGTLSHLVGMLHPSDRVSISRKYAIPRPEMLESWMRAIAGVRNTCAHHGRLWNHPLVDQPSLPTAAEMPSLGHLRVYNATQTRLYAVAAVCAHLLSVMQPASQWRTRMRDLWHQFPAIPGINPAQAGFMPTWRTLPLWR